jgi:hypothetical protein
MIMSNYPTLRDILGAAFAIGIGLSDAAQRRFLERALSSGEWRARFDGELLDALSNDQTSWRELLSNDAYEVVEAESEAEARAIAISLLWDATFPGKPVPEARKR